MRGLDYKWLEAFECIIRLGGFDKAAEELFISQSAVSQRVKQLERYLSQPVLIRENPPRATLVGNKLLGLYQKVRLLENELIPELNNENQTVLPVFIATNGDSLATWLLPALNPVLSPHNIELHLTVLGEARTIDKLKSGEVTGAISSNPQAISGCESIFLGYLECICVGSPTFFHQYFSKGVTKEALLTAPMVSYDQYDLFHQDFLREHYGIDASTGVTHRVPNAEAFIQLARMGAAYCLMPKLQIQSDLNSGLLVDIAQGKGSRYPIYWHHWQLESGVLEVVTNAIIQYARKVLPQH